MMALEDQKRRIILIYLRRRCTSSSPLTKITKLMPASYLFPVISACCKRNEVSKEVILISLSTQTDFGGIFKIIQVYERYDGANKMQIEQHWVDSNCSIFSAKKLETTSTAKKQQNLKNGKVRFRLNIDVRKEMEASRLNAVECYKTDYVHKRSTEF